ncbi:MAG: GGDEF domain-containing protein, partial [Proteobacteria bacterium]
MYINRFNLFSDTLKSILHADPRILGHWILRKSSDSWLSDNEAEQPAQVILEALVRKTTFPPHWRERGSKYSYYLIKDIESVVVIETATPSRSPTREKLHQKIDQCFKNSTFAYDASHDQLTGSLNSRSLEKILIDSLTSEGSSHHENDEAIRSIAEQSATALISLDIDHFKQVNDSYGHDYGDIVLVCFSQRIQQILNHLRDSRPEISLIFARSGGEEFSVIASGPISEEIILEISENIRQAIEIQPIPNDNDWNTLPDSVRNPSLRIPMISERKVTSSIGISSIVNPTPEKHGRKLAQQLKNESDAALYRAKSGGRNTVRYFPSIRGHHGTILEHHPDTGIAAIDIGRDADVQLGHEFHVFHPDFSGTKPFIRSDGRSKKTLGLYPRIDCGRIVVFDSQREIPFCHVEEKNSPTNFTPGSGLEYIPVGTITHLIRSASTLSSQGS